MTDDHDIRQLIAGDEAAFKKIYYLYGERIYALAFRFLKNREQSEEIVQETFINLWLSRTKLDSGGDLWLYLYVIAKRLSLNALRKVCRSAELTQDLLYHINKIHNGNEENFLAHELEHFADRIINQLPKQQQIIFKLSRMEGLSHKEIAAQLRISPNTVKNHMVEALKTIKSRLCYADIIFISIILNLFFS